MDRDSGGRGTQYMYRYCLDISIRLLHRFRGPSRFPTFTENKCLKSTPYRYREMLNYKQIMPKGRRYKYGIQNYRVTLFNCLVAVVFSISPHLQQLCEVGYLLQSENLFICSRYFLIFFLFPSDACDTTSCK